MSHSSRDIIENHEKAADEEHAVAPLSELTTERPVQRHDRGTERERIRDEEQQREQEGTGYDEGIPLAEITSEPPVERREEPSAAAAEVLPPLSPWATRLYTISYLIFFAIWGTLARLGVQALTMYPGAPVLTGVVWANVGGCILMGFFIEDRNIFREEWGQPTNSGKSQQQLRRLPSTTSAQERWLKTHKTVKKSIPLYIGLTTGFCGSFTSFSSFMRDAFLALSNDLVDHSVPSSPGSLMDGRARGDSFMAVVAVLAITVSTSIAGFYLGAHLALALDSWIPVVPFRFTRNVLDGLIVVLGWGCWLGAVLMAIWPPHNAWRTDALFAIVFAPLGCLFRFYMSLALNARIPVFPLGTFAVNILGTGVLGMCFDLQHVAGIGAPATSWGFDPLASSRPSLFPGVAAEIEATARSILVSCQVLQGVMDGFCGATTTVSTWIAELTSIGVGTSRRRRFAWAYLYGLVSMGVGLGLLVVVIGSVRWSRGFDQPYC